MKTRHCIILLALGTLCQAWQATFSDATQCEDMTVTWAGTGGEKLGPPFVIRLVAFGLAPLTVDVPTTAWSDISQSGSYNVNIPWPAGTNYVAVMDDGYAPGTGGVTGIQTVKSSSNSSCVTTAITQPEHVFDVYGTFIQCSVVSMNWTKPATSSTVITGLVPNGVAFQLDPPVANVKSTTWNLNIPGGTAFVLMYNASSGPGLASRLLVSQANGGSNGCLSSGAYPSTTAAQTGVSQATGTGSLQASATSASVSPTSSSGTFGSGSSNTRNLGAIIGATVGVVVFLCAVAVLAFCFYRRRHRFARVRPESPSSGKEINLDSNTTNLDNYSRRYDAQSHHNFPQGAVVLPFVLPSTGSTQETQSPTRKEPFQPHTRSTARQMSRDTLASAESSHAPATSSARRDRSNTDDSEPMFIQHADGGSAPIQPRAREVIELPPNYDQLPRPLPRDGEGQTESNRAQEQRKI